MKKLSLLVHERVKSSVIRQKGEFQNMCFKKTKHVNFSEKRTFLTPWYAHVRNSKKRSFSGKFGVLCFLEIPVLRFALLPYYQRSVFFPRNVWKYHLKKGGVAAVEVFVNKWKFPWYSVFVNIAVHRINGHLANIYLLKINNRNTRRSWGICSKLTIKIPERRQ